MKEKPISLKDAEVRLLLAGATLIVVPMKKQPPTPQHQIITMVSTTDRAKRKHEVKHHWAIVNGLDIVSDTEEYFSAPCSPGDVLWVREAFAHVTAWNHFNKLMPQTEWLYRADKEWPVNKWKPSVHMHRLASRITYPVAKVECCQVQGLTDVETIAMALPVEKYCKPRYALRNHLKTLYPGAWDNNLWVWKIWREI